MLFFSLLENPIFFFAFILSLIIAITVHEFAHAWTAYRLGDETPKYLGRLSLNPLAHLDPVGTIFLLLAGFGWGKPVPINSASFRNPVFDEIKVALSGPISNLIVATILGIIIRFIPLGVNFQFFLEIIIFYNLVLMIFNLLPIPPLDGSRILRLFLDENTYAFLEQYGIFILILLLVGTPFLQTIVTGLVSSLFVLLTGQPLPFI